MYTCQCEGLQMGQSSGVLLEEVSAFQRCPLIQASLYIPTYIYVCMYLHMYTHECVVLVCLAVTLNFILIRMYIHIRTVLYQ